MPKHVTTSDPLRIAVQALKFCRTEMPHKHETYLSDVINTVESAIAVPLRMPLIDDNDIASPNNRCMSSVFGQPCWGKFHVVNFGLGDAYLRLCDGHITCWHNGMRDGRYTPEPTKNGDAHEAR